MSYNNLFSELSHAWLKNVAQWGKHKMPKDPCTLSFSDLSCKQELPVHKIRSGSAEKAADMEWPTLAAVSANQVAPFLEIIGRE